MAKKSIPNSIIFLMSLGIDVWAEFGRFLVPKWKQNGTNIESNITTKATLKAKNQRNASWLGFSWFSAFKVNIDF